MIRSPSSASAISTIRKPIGGDDEYVGVARSARIHKAGLAGQHAGLGQEAPGAELDDRDDVAEPAPGADGDRARDEHEHAGADVAGPDDLIAGRVAASRPEPPEPVDVRRTEARKHPLDARIRGGHRVLPASFPGGRPPRRPAVRR
jgi:hypothetical protein